ncbi:equilibrative nucleoside transporter 2 [Eublepharis macularius]|uniref:Equilibrative nucleoside transporter 2 n=1 Tax=Eublepharis macularius TaxID=481883 RepID=A0AA97K0B8_EUBMA|nr:equilibrative nucleoside transporter 2 [Eublepharis macularius]XP_054846174.1 equilibrative nucleoside transporter 2 [Eublepharis macularius]
MASQGAPKDSFHCVAIIFFLLGLGTLLPWNFFITAIPYFQSRLIVGNCSAAEENENGTVLGLEPASHCTDDFNFSNWLALLSQLPLLLFTLLNSLLYQCIPDKVRVLGSLFGILFLFSLTAALVRLEMPAQSFFSITMASVWFINSFCAVLQGSLFGQLGSFPQSFSTLFLSGQGMAGTFAAVAMLLSMASGVDAQTSALSYFIIPCFGTLISIICYFVLPHKDFARHYLEKRHQEVPDYELETKAGLLTPEEDAVIVSPEEDTTALPPSCLEEPLHVSNGKILAPEQVDIEYSPKVMNGSNGTGLAPPKASVVGVLQKIWQLALCIVLVFSVTLSVFPAMTASVASVSENKTWSKFFTPVCCFLLFNVMDWLGRSATSYFLWPEKSLPLLPVAVGLRLLLVPLLLLCNIPQRSYLPVLFHQDAWFVLFMVVFSLSNGYFVSLTMCLAPKQVKPHESELAGAIMTFFLALGLSCGAGLSFILRALL